MEARPVPHPSADSLRAFGLGQMDDAGAQAVLSHLDICPGCRKIVAAVSGDDFLARFRQAHSRSGTPAPAKSLAEASNAPPPSAALPTCHTTMPNLPPELANHPDYEVLRELGRGGMGVVYLAKNKPMDRLEVLKVVNKTLLEHPGVIERFQREIRSAAKLSHANIVTAYSALRQGGLLAFAMEYIPGQDLAGLVKARGPLPVPYACYYAQQVAFGLQHAFEKGMVHRDIKPQNLMLTRDGPRHLVKILDFGLAKAARERGEKTDLTGEGRMLGTPDFMAPEQTVDAARADIRADVYSLGCTLYYLLSGGPPFTGRGLYEILQAHHSVEARALNLVRAEVPEGLAAVVRKMMAKDGAQRYQRPVEVVQALAPFIRQSPKSAPPPPLVTAGATGSLERPSAVPQAPSRPWDTLASGAARTSQPWAAWRKWGLGGGIGMGILLLTLLVLWASGAFRVKTKDGTIVLENVPDGAEVLVDGATVQVKTGDGKTITITITPGKKHRLEVKKEGFKVFGQEVEIAGGTREIIVVRLESQAPPGKPAPPASAATMPPVIKPRGPFKNSVGMEFVWIKPGSFRMGSPPGEVWQAGDETPHDVTLTKGYYLGVHLVTQYHWEQVMGKSANRSRFLGKDEDEKKQLPVDNVSWDDCREFCRKLGAREGRRYRLPTEAEWEYARRAGTTAVFWWGNSITTDQANYNGHEPFVPDGRKGEFRKKTTPVRYFKPNPWGLYDMQGNLWQWCEDWYGPYGENDKTDPLESEKGSEAARVLRGGDWSHGAAWCRAASRYRVAPSIRNDIVGCRVVLCLD